MQIALSHLMTDDRGHAEDAQVNLQARICMTTPERLSCVLAQSEEGNVGQSGAANL